MGKESDAGASGFEDGKDNGGAVGADGCGLTCINLEKSR